MIKKVLGLGIVVAVIGMSVVAYAFFKPPEKASAPIEAIPVAVEPPPALEPTQAHTTPEEEPAVEGAAAAGDTTTLNEDPVAGVNEEPEGAEAPVAQATDQPEVAVAPTMEATEPDTAPEVSADPVIFEIVQADSEVRFFIDEVLNGAPKTVIGTTNQVAGQIAIFPDDPGRTVIGTILVNARTLETDNDFRNRAIKNRILNTDQYEFIDFTPTEIIGLPEGVAVGTSFSFKIVGDLTVRDITRETVFDATVRPITETRLEGIASTTILRADFNLTIPEARGVAGVTDEVILEIAFVALAN